MFGFKQKPLLLILNGPNLNLLGEREPTIYGHDTLADICRDIRAHAESKGARCRFFQSNHEGRIIDFIHQQRKKAQGMVINPGALTHSSYALRDAIAAAGIPAVEVHLSDIRKREPFRRKSVVSPVCLKQVSGLGKRSYLVGIDVLLETIGASSVSGSEWAGGRTRPRGSKTNGRHRSPKRPRASNPDGNAGRS